MNCLFYVFPRAWRYERRGLSQNKNGAKTIKQQLVTNNQKISEKFIHYFKHTIRKKITQPSIYFGVIYK